LKLFECLICPSKFGRRGHFNVNLKTIHDKLKSIEC
jgi:hypothetical protein